MLNTSCICIISIVVAICVIGLILLIVFSCLKIKNKRYNNYRTFGGANELFTNFFSSCKDYLIFNAMNDSDIFENNYKTNMINLYSEFFKSTLVSDPDLSGDKTNIWVNMTFQNNGFEKIKLLIWFYCLTIYNIAIEKDDTKYFKDLNLVYNKCKKEEIPDNIQNLAMQIKQTYKSYNILQKDMRFLTMEKDKMLEIHTKTGEELEVLKSQHEYKQIFEFFKDEDVWKQIKALNRIFVLNESNDKIMDFDAILFSYFDFGIVFAEEENMLETIMSKLILIANNIKLINEIYQKNQKTKIIYKCDYNKEKYKEVSE